MYRKTISVATPAELQGALNTAGAGDTIILAAGVVYSGNFRLPNRGPLTDYITITGSMAGSLPAGRVRPDDNRYMPAIVTPNSTSAITALAGANHFKLVGLEVHPGPGIYVNDLINLIGGLTTLESLPSDIVVDRCYIHGDPTVGSKRGIALNGRQTTVQNSYISAFMSTEQDSQAVAGWNGPGPFTITNNYLQASGENLMFGGAKPAIPGLVPSDIAIEGNYFSKPLSWHSSDPAFAGTAWEVKNLLELKSAQRVTIRRNMFENCWISAQVGFAVQMTVRTTSNIDPPEVINDVLFEENVLTNIESGINFSGRDSNGLGSSRNVSIVNNVLLGVRDKAFQVLNGMQDLTIKHNTAMPPYATVMGDGAPSQDFIFQDNMMSRGKYGVFGSGSSEGNKALSKFFPGAVFQGNAIIGGNYAIYPPANEFPAALADVGFVDYLSGNLALAPGSPYLKAATDGTQVGADVAAVMAYASLAMKGGPHGDLSAGLIGRWNFDEGSGAIAHDVAGGGYDAEIKGATWTLGRRNSGLLFDGITTSAITPAIPIGNEFSLSVWVSPASRTRTTQCRYARILETRYDAGFYLGTDDTGKKYKFIVKGGAGSAGGCGANYGCAQGGAVSGGWHLVAATFDGATARLYVDSALVATETFTRPGNTNYPLHIGQYRGGAGYNWNGALDEIRLYERALTAAEVADIYAEQ